MLLALLCVVSRCAAAATQLLLAFAVTRHGSRNALVKTPQLVEPGGGVTLLPAGQRQCYNAGAAFRARYLDAASCAAGGGAGGAPTDTCLLSGRSGGGGGAPLYGLVTAANVSWSNFNLLARSSALDRTILSARSFLEGDRCSAALQAGKCVRADPSRCACPFRRWLRRCFPASLRAYSHCVPAVRRAASASIRCRRRRCGRHARAHVRKVPCLRRPPQRMVRPHSAHSWPLELYRNLNSVAYSPAEASLVLRYGSAEFAVKTNESAPLRASVAALLAPYTAAPNASDLRNWYNVYDAFSVARLGVGDPMPAINATLWSQIVRPRSQRASRRAALTRAAVGR